MIYDMTMTEPNGAEILFAKPQFEVTLEKIKGYVALKDQVVAEESHDDTDLTSLESFNVEVPEKVVVGMDAKLEMPGLEEMKGDFLSLGKAMEVLEKSRTMIPGTLWTPVRNLVESYVSSEAAPKDVEERFMVLEPVIDLFERNVGQLKENNIIGDSVIDWIGTVDSKLGEMMEKREAQKNAAV